MAVNKHTKRFLIGLIAVGSTVGVIGVCILLSLACRALDSRGELGTAALLAALPFAYFLSYIMDWVEMRT